MKPFTQSLSNQPASLDDLRPPVRGLILDGDGVLWKATQSVGDLAAIFAEISRRRLGVTIATNNAMKTVDEYVEFLAQFGVTLEVRQIVTAGEATADTLAADFPQRGTVYVVGEHGVREALRRHGFEVVIDPETDANYVAVVAGIDRDLTYDKLRKASTLVRQAVPYYATNPDPTFPTPEGLVPGAGAIVAAINAASGGEPIAIGKPSPLVFRIAAGRMDLGASDVLVVGDRLETDIAGGQAFGARTAAVLSGVSTIDQVLAWMPPPTLVAKDLSTLLGI